MLTRSCSGLQANFTKKAFKWRFLRSSRYTSAPVFSCFTTTQQACSLSHGVTQVEPKPALAHKHAMLNLARPAIAKSGKRFIRLCSSEMLQYSSSFTVAESDLLSQWKQQLQLSPASGLAVFILGPMAAGKSTVLKEEFRCHQLYGKFAYVDTDEIMESLDGFTADKVEYWYPIARRLAIHLTDWLLENKISFVAEGTCVKYDELEDYMERLLTAGYKIEVRRVCNASLDIVLKRADQRFNRPIRHEIVREIYYNSLSGLKDLARVNACKGLYKEI